MAGTLVTKEKITALQFKDCAVFRSALGHYSAEELKVLKLQPSSYTSGTMETFRKRFKLFLPLIAEFNLKARDNNLNEEINEYKLKSSLLGLGT